MSCTVDVINQLIAQIPADVVRAAAVAAMLALAGIAACLVGLVLSVRPRAPAEELTERAVVRTGPVNTDRNHNLDGQGADR